MVAQVKPQVLESIEKAQQKNQKDYANKMAKSSNKKRKISHVSGSNSLFEVGDFVIITAKGRAPKIQKEPEVYKVMEIGTVDNKIPGKLKLTDDSTPPKLWWEAVSNIGLFMRTDAVE
jgi:hypothetical protein